MLNISYLIVLAIVAATSQQATVSKIPIDADALVQSLAQLPTPRQVRGASEERRSAIHAQLRELGPTGIDALAVALTDQNVMVRRNALLALYDLGHGVSDKGRVAKVDIRRAVPALVAAFHDEDASVRAWSIQALTGVKPIPPSSMAPLAERLADGDVGVRLSACGAVGEFGPVAASLKQDLQRLMFDEHQDVRTCARSVLDKISK